MVNIMEHFLNKESNFETVRKLLETINRTTDDYLFIWDIQADARWFFGNITDHYDIRRSERETCSTPEMMRIIHPADRAAVLASLTDVAQGKKDTHSMDYRWINRQGQKIWINCNGTVIRDETNAPHLMIGRVSEENLRHLFNPLTGLWNKVKLHEDLESWLAESKGSLLLLDIDSLSAINLSRGRAYGDQLLKDVADFCDELDCVRMAYHVDHDHFALILNVDSQEEIQVIYEHIKESMAEKCTFTASAVPIDKTMFFDGMQLIDSVNMTLKRAKDISRNHIEFFSVAELTRKVASLALLEDLKQSVENDFEGFELHYQPQIRSGNYEIYGVEALLRYSSKKRGRVFPDEFIPLLEQSRLIQEVGLWVLREAATQCLQWRKTLPELRVSVNFSALQFEDPFLAEKVIQTIQEVGLEGSALTIEITESMELHSSHQIFRIMRDLRAYDINFAIDDFGTGYSNLGYLKQLNVDEIKIDRIFISGLEKDTFNHKLISNVIEFAKKNGMRICCEGVENAGELALLEMMLPDLIQGYFFDRPNTPRIIERTYMDQETPEYLSRLALIQKIHEFKERMGLLHFDPQEILQENGVGLWALRINEARTRYELHIDKTMHGVIAADPEIAPTECFDYLFSHIHPQYVAFVQDHVDKMILGQKAVQVEFPWMHPHIGEVMIRFSGKRVNNSEGMILLEGYCKVITDVTGA